MLDLFLLLGQTRQVFQKKVNLSNKSHFNKNLDRSFCVYILNIFITSYYLKITQLIFIIDELYKLNREIEQIISIKF